MNFRESLPQSLLKEFFSFLNTVMTCFAGDGF
jgi:hypothetical protein